MTKKEPISKETMKNIKTGLKQIKEGKGLTKEQVFGKDKEQEIIKKVMKEHQEDKDHPNWKDNSCDVCIDKALSLIKKDARKASDGKGSFSASTAVEHEKEIEQTTSNGINVTTWLCGNPSAQGQKQRYPSRFVHFLKKFYPIENKKVLSMFSGASDIGDTTDIRKETGADIIAPYDRLPIKDNTYDMVIADPPYNSLYASEWKKDLPKPKRILEEASRIVKPNGLIMILHIIVVPNYKHCNCKRVAIHPILCGSNNAIRVLSVFRKRSERNETLL